MADDKVMTPEEIALSIVGQHTDDALDLLIKNDLKWKIVGMNLKKFPTADEGMVPNRILIELWEEKITSAKLG